MTPEEIESWYEAEKQRVEEEFVKGMEQGGKPEELRPVFDKKLKAAIEKYNREYTKILKPSEFKKKKALFRKRMREYEKKTSEPVRKLMDSLTHAFREH